MIGRAAASLCLLAMLTAQSPAPQGVVRATDDSESTISGSYPAVAVIIARLRREWPEVAPVQITERQRFEYRNGTIMLGRAKLNELARQEAGDDAPAVLTFLLSHEAWHSVQAARNSAPDFAQMREDKRLECEADAIGASTAYRILSRDMSSSQTEATLGRILRYVRSVPASGPLTYRYLEADDRLIAISAGWNLARNPNVFRYIGFTRNPEPTQALSTLCRQLSEYSDGSIGLIQTDQTIEKRPDGGEIRHVTAMSKSGRSIDAHLLGLTWGSGGEISADGQTARRLEQVQLIEIQFQPKATHKFDLTFDKPGSGTPQEETRYFWTQFYDVRGRSSQATAVYKDNIRTAYCGDRLLAAPRSEDRTVFSRLVLIGDAAIDDFSAIRSNRLTDSEYGQQIDILPAFRFDARDYISTRGGGASETSLVLSRIEFDEDVIEEFNRIKTLLENICGTSSVTASPGARPDKTEMSSFTVERFTRHSTIFVTLWMDKDFPRPAEGKPIRGGNISIRIVRRVAS